MIEKKFSNEIIDLLHKQIGSVLLSYEYGSGDSKFSRAYGNVRICFEKMAVELTNIEHPTPFFDDIEDMSGFSGNIVDSFSPFKTYLDEESNTTIINESIVKIEIIEDTIDINNGAYQIRFDEALIIKTEQNSYTFFRDWQFSEIIHFAKNENYCKLYPIQKIIENWNNDGEYNISVTRRTIPL